MNSLKRLKYLGSICSLVKLVSFLIVLLLLFPVSVCIGFTLSRIK